MAPGFEAGDGSRFEWTVDPDGCHLLGVWQVLVEDGPLGKKGDVVAPGSIEVRAVVDKAGDVPGRPQARARS